MTASVPWQARFRRCVAALALCAALPLPAATPPGTVIPNTATVHYELLGAPMDASATATFTTSSHTQATIRLLKYLPRDATGGTLIAVPPVQCSTSGSTTGPFITAPGPTVAGTTVPLTVPGEYLLTAAPVYDVGDPIFVEITDYDRNADPAAAETVLVTLTTSNGDHEVLRLTETGLSTGVFVGYIQSSSAPATAGTCTLSVAGNTRITAEYIDPTDQADLVSVQALIDPVGLVFDSATGKPVDQATVTLLEAATGRPARAYCSDGVTPYPSSVVTGSSFAACGGTVHLPGGGYQFPHVSAGAYRLNVRTGAGYEFPSAVPAATLQSLSGSPFTLVPGSRNDAFVQSAGPLNRVDIPIDPVSGDLQILKTAGSASVSAGDFVPYTIAIHNLNGASAARGVRIADVLPPGFRYRPGSARLNGLSATAPAVAPDGRSLTFTLGNIAPGASVGLRYVATVTSEARPGPAENVASAVAPVTSNSGRAIVLVRDDLFRQRATLMGRVITGSCEESAPEARAQPTQTEGAQEGVGAGLANVRIVMEDGRYALTDSDGNWHLDNIRPGTHVVQMDRGSLPKGYEAMTCREDSQSAGRSFSRFVNVRGGTLWRTDFHVREPKGANRLPPQAPQASPAPRGTVEPQSESLVERLPFDKSWLATADPGRQWLHPQESFEPALPAIKVAVKHLRGDRVELRMNGERVSAANYDGMLGNAAATVFLSTWSGVSLREGDNRLEIIVHDSDGQVVLAEQRSIHYAGSPVRAEIIDSASHLEADGQSRPVIAVRFVDSSGRPARRGLIGEFQVSEPYLAWDRIASLERMPLAGRPGGKPHFEIGSDGIALIELAPTARVGEVVMTFELRQGHRQELRTWLKPAKRDWILVGFGEGTVGARQLSGNMQALRDSDAGDPLFDGDRVAFYAKGVVRGEYLLTIAYDSAKGRGGSPDTLKQVIDPNQYYTLYGDASDPQFDAASTRKLYLRIERSQFYALFGDYDTGLTVTELARYSRTVNGFKSEYRGGVLAYNTFATSTAQSYVKDEFPGDGTSGPYRLSQANIVINTDKVHLETRDRFRSEVILATRDLEGYLDYDIDYVLGTVFVREPLPVHDADLNPIYLIVEYESAGSAEQKLTYGGRASARPWTRTEVGVTHIHEGNTGASGDLTGIDLTTRLGERSVLKGEFAASTRELAGMDASGDAWKLELTHADDILATRLYAREEQTGFGLGQQSPTEAGTEKIGGEARYKVSDAVKLDGEAYREEVFADGAARDFLQALAAYRVGDGSVRAGVLLDHDSVNGEDTASHQALAGATYQVLDQRLTMKADAAMSVAGEASSVDYPDRYQVGADYKLNSTSSVFLEHEIARGETVGADLTRVGIRMRPWSGAEVASSVGDQAVSDGSRLYSSLGLVQRWQVTRAWQADIAVDRTETLKSTSATSLNPTVPLTSGSPEGDYTAVALGASYADGPWSGNGRIEWRDGSTDSRRNALVGLQYRIDAERTLAAGFIFTDSSGSVSGGALGLTSPFESPVALGASAACAAAAGCGPANPYGVMNPTGLDDRKADGRVGYVWRPLDGQWVWLDRFDVIAESTDAVGAPSATHKLVNNLNANFLSDWRTQISLQYGAKYAFDTVDGAGYRGYTDLIGLEIRWNLDENWDIGADTSLLHDWSVRSAAYGLGASLGRRVATNVWIAVGYNVLGFRDDDFAGASYRARGVFLSVRAKIDEDSLGLNRSVPAAGQPR